MCLSNTTLPQIDYFDNWAVSPLMAFSTRSRLLYVYQKAKNLDDGEQLCYNVHIL